MNIVAEDVMRPILALVFDLPNLTNMNSSDKNSAGVDLGDREAGVAIQITSRTDNEKVKDMLDTLT